MRYLFRGLIRETGKAVVGHVEADTEETAFNALADNGIVTESLSPDPKPTFPSPGQGQSAPRFADALDSAFDASAHQIAFDDLTERYRGKRVWVIDRDKIRRRVSQVVDQAMSEAQSELDTDTETRERVAKAIEGLFKDSKNITSPAELPAPTPLPMPVGYGSASAGASAPPVAGLDAQVDRLANLITTAESVLATIQAAARNASFGGGGGGGAGGGGGGRRRGARASKMTLENDVLLEIFKSNMQLQRGVAVPGPVAVAPTTDAAGAGDGPGDAALGSAGADPLMSDAESGDDSGGSAASPEATRVGGSNDA